MNHNTRHSKTKHEINLHPSELLPKTCIGGFIFEGNAQCVLCNILISEFDRNCSRNSGESRTYCGSLSASSNSNITKVFNLIPIHYVYISDDRYVYVTIAMCMMCST